MTPEKFRSLSHEERIAYLDHRLYQQMPFAEPDPVPNTEPCAACGKVEADAQFCGRCRRVLCPWCADHFVTHYEVWFGVTFIPPDPDDPESMGQWNAFHERRERYGHGILSPEIQAEVRAIQQRERE